MNVGPTMLLNGTEVAKLLPLEDCIDVVEAAFRLHGEGKYPKPGILGTHSSGGGFHVKTGLITVERSYYAAKVNANFPQNPTHGMPTIQGVVLLFDADRGRLLAAMDSISITRLRTAASTAVAAKYLARGDSRIATICGCGSQGRIQLQALTRVCSLEEIYAWDINPLNTIQFAKEMSAQLGLQVAPVDEVRPAVRQSDICITCTPAEKFFIMAEDVRPGTFVAAVGADSEVKQELDPRLFAGGAKVVADLKEQAAAIGDLHHAVAAGITTPSQIHGELGEVVCGQKPGRLTPQEITIFDSTGVALQDVASAVFVYKAAVQGGLGSCFVFAA